MTGSLTSKERLIVLGLAVAAVAAHLINLGLTPLFADEPVRATVAYEMIQRDNYIVPTTFGEYYYRKPPFYNWVLIGFFQLFQSYSLFVFRLPSLIPLFLLSACTFWWSRKYIGERAAVLAAFGFMLNGPMLTRDSLLGHIDLLYALITFLGFAATFHFWQRSKPWPLFLITYALCAAGVLMKGLPSFLFQGLTLVVWFGFKRDFKALFSLAHLAGIVLFAMMVGGYFYLYSQENGLSKYLYELYYQSSQRTVIERGLWAGLLNFVAFPFKLWTQLLPTALFLLMAIQKGTVRRWLGNDFLTYSLLTLVVNIVPYWLSPGYHVRYLFMLYPLIFILGAEAFFHPMGMLKRWEKHYRILFFVAGTLMTLSFSYVFMVPELRQLAYALPASIVLMLFSAFILYLWKKWPDYWLYYTFLFIITFRLGFDFIVIPHRIYLEENVFVNRKERAERILEIVGSEPIQVQKDIPIATEYAYYIGVAKDTVLYKCDGIREGTFQLTLPRYVEGLNVEEYYRFPSDFENKQIILVKLKP